MNTLSSKAESGLHGYLAILARRRRLLLIVFTVTSVASVLLAGLIPSVYRSQAVILIEQQEIPKELVRSTVTSFADQRIQIISQRVMTSSNLAQIIDKYDLYAEQRRSEPREVVIDRMRKDVVREMISADVVDPRSGRPTEATIAFRLSYDSQSPTLAQKVANELVSLYLNENIKSRTESVAETVSFLEVEAKRLGDTVKELEANLASFKLRNVESRPELEEVTRAMMNRTDLEIAEIDRRLNAASQQRIYLKGELGQLEPFRHSSTRGTDTPAARLEAAISALAVAEASYAESHPDVVRLRKQVDALRSETDPATARAMHVEELERARNQLSAKLERYAADHPEVAKAKRVVEKLEAKIAALPADEQSQVLNPAYIGLRARMDGVESEISSLQTKRQQLELKNEEALKNLAKMPEVEAEYKSINREYENTLAKYREVTAKQMEARLSQNLENERKSERFVMIESPLLPQEPARPNRIAILLIGLVLAVGAGLGGVGLAEALDTKVRGRAGIQRILTAPPLASIPYVTIPGEGVGGISLGRWVVGSLVAAVIVLTAIHFMFKPLDVLWFVLMRKSGM